MTDQCSTHFSDREQQPAKLMNCQECPFRTANRNREHPLGIQYTDGEFAKLWRNVSQEGGFFGCHMWDSDAHPFTPELPEAGFHKPADVGARIECAGMVKMIERELDISYGCETFEEYKAKRPLGLTKKAFSVFGARIRGEQQPPLRFSDHIDSADILDPHDVIDPQNFKWKLTEQQADAFLNGIRANLPFMRDCDCLICAEHTTVHTAQTLTTAEDLTVMVDADLHPLLRAMADAGIRTTDSCINMHEVFTAIAPDQLAPAMNGHERGTLNYETVLREKAAFIRLRNESQAEQAFIDSAAKVSRVVTLSSGPITQIEFHSEQLSALLEAVKA